LRLDPTTAQILLQFAPDALVLVNGSGQIVYVNDAVAEVFGYRPQELIGESLAELVPERFRDSHSQHVHLFTQHPGKRAMGQRGVPLFARRRDGSEFPASISLSPIHIDGDLHVVAAIRDITDAQRITDELRCARDEADRANRAKSFFLATASHDLRQPLQALQLLSSGLRRRLDGPASVELFEQHQQALNAMTELLNAVLDIGKLESGTLEPRFEEVSAAQIFSELRGQFESLAVAKGLKFEIEPCSDYLRTDRVLMLRMIQNLLANAIKYTVSGGVSMRCRHGEDCLHIEVADTGIGIPDDRLHGVFEAYYQLDRPHRGQGLGLGLAIVKRIATLLGYDIGIQSEPGEGTRFRISVPGEFLVSGHTSAAAGPAAVATHTGHRILVIEDDRSVRDAMLIFLRSEGFEAIGAAAPREAEELFRREPNGVHLLISDYHLGDRKNGGDVVAWLRTLAGTRLPAILLSGDTSLALRSLQNLPGTRVLNKPVDVDKLVQTIAQLLKHEGREDRQ
jgi:PAS domain S-box-containing protein